MSAAQMGLLISISCPVLFLNCTRIFDLKLTLGSVDGSVRKSWMVILLNSSSAFRRSTTGFIAI